MGHIMTDRKRFDIQYDVDLADHLKRVYGVKQMDISTVRTFYDTEKLYSELIGRLAVQIQGWCDKEGTRVESIAGILGSGKKPADDIAKLININTGQVFYPEYHLLPLTSTGTAPIETNRTGYTPVVPKNGMSDWGIQRVRPIQSENLAQLNPGSTLLIMDDQTTAGINASHAILDARRARGEDIRIIHAALTYGVHFPHAEQLDADRTFCGFVEDTYQFLPEVLDNRMGILHGHIFMPWVPVAEIPAIAKKLQNGARLHRNTPVFLQNNPNFTH